MDNNNPAVPGWFYLKFPSGLNVGGQALDTETKKYMTIAIGAVAVAAIIAVMVRK